MKGSGDGHGGSVWAHSSSVPRKGCWRIRKVGLIEERVWNALESCHFILWATEDHVQAGRQDRVVPAECHQRLGRGWNQQEQRGREGEIVWDDWHRALLWGEKDRKTEMEASAEGRSTASAKQPHHSIQKELEGLLPAGGIGNSSRVHLSWVFLIADKRFISAVHVISRNAY